MSKESEAALLLSSLSILAIVKAVYESTTPLAPTVVPAAAQNVLLHLEKLALEGKVINRTPNQTAAPITIAATNSTTAPATALAAASAAETTEAVALPIRDVPIVSVRVRFSALILLCRTFLASFPLVRVPFHDCVLCSCVNVHCVVFGVVNS